MNNRISVHVNINEFIIRFYLFIANEHRRTQNKDRNRCSILALNQQHVSNYFNNIYIYKEIIMSLNYIQAHD